jgi:hypothetical protein
LLSALVVVDAAWRGSDFLRAFIKKLALSRCLIEPRYYSPPYQSQHGARHSPALVLPLNPPSKPPAWIAFHFHSQAFSFIGNFYILPGHTFLFIIYLSAYNTLISLVLWCILKIINETQKVPNVLIGGVN